MKSLLQLVEDNRSKVVAIGEFGLGMVCIACSGYVTLVLCGVDMLPWCCVEWIYYPGVVWSGYVTLVLCGVDMLPWCCVEWICYPGVVWSGNVTLVLCGVEMLPWCCVEWKCYPGVVCSATRLIAMF